MKESISLTTIFQIVILFILLFAGIMALTINNSNAFGVKDEITNIIQLAEGDFLDNESGDLRLNSEIVKVISETSYRTTGSCDNGYTGFTKNGDRTDGSDAAICIKCISTTAGYDDYLKEHLQTGESIGVLTGEQLPAYYYQITVFYQLDLPIIKQVYDFKTKGETKIMYGNESGLCKS